MPARKKSAGKKPSRRKPPSKELARRKAKRPKRGRHFIDLDRHAQARERPDEAVEHRVERGPDKPPLVTVFGAGITGLSVAHELIERGFEVQLVERLASIEQEYEVEVGGIAANQLGAVKEELGRLHPHIFWREEEDYIVAVKNGEIEDPDAKEFLELPRQTKRALREKRKAALRTLRAFPMQPTRRPVALTETIRFANPQDECPDLLEALDEKGPEAKALLRRCGYDPKDKPGTSRQEFRESLVNSIDEHRVTAAEKLESVARKIGGALIRRIRGLTTERAAAERYAAEEGRTGPDLENLFDGATLRREILLVEIRGHTDSGVPGDVARRIGLLRARLVKELLVERIQRYLEAPEPARELRRALEQLYKRVTGSTALRDATPAAFIRNIGRHLVAVSRGCDEPVGTPRRRRDRIRSNRVDFRILEALLPGEHGYRYFPAYYRHLFDVMKRTPILDLEGEETGRTAFSQLVTPAGVAISLPGTKAIESIARRRFRSLKELREAVQVMVEKVGISGRDMQLFFLRIFVFMTACRERRQDWGKLSWLEFLDGRQEHSPHSIRGRTRFSPGCEALLRETSQALVAMDAEETDACTNAQNSVQLLLDYQGEGSGTDMTLNGATSTAWLRHWKSYLRRQGVRFFIGELESLEAHPEHGLVPVAKYRLDPSLPAREPIPEDPSFDYVGYGASADGVARMPDFYVLALSFDQAAKLAWRARRNDIALDGDLATLAEMDARCIERDAKGNDLVQHAADDPINGTLRDANGLPKNALVYPLRDLSGIQFFFPSQVRLGLGHVVYPSSKWGLTSISQVAHWRTRLSPRGVYLGQVSVDIGDFYEPHAMDVIPRYLRRADRGVHAELRRAKTAWRCEWWEIGVRTWDQILETLDPKFAAGVEPPRYYHLDSGLVLQRSKVATEYTAGAVRDRYFPDRLAGNETPFLINLPGQWEMRPGQLGVQGPEEGVHGIKLRPFDPWYRISNGRWVLAGTYMATHTRMMTMEACNESARHAVNAILHELLTCPEPGKYNSEGKLLGQLCAIYDPFDNEVDDLEPLKQLDKALFEEGLPHFVEILGIEKLMASTPEADAKQSAAARLARVLESTRKTYADDWGFLTKQLDAGIGEEVVRQTRDGLETLKRSKAFREVAALVEDFLRDLTSKPD